MPMLRAESLTELPFAQLLSLALKKLAVERAHERPADDPPRQLWFQESQEELHQLLQQLQVDLAEELPPLGRLHFLTGGLHPYSSEVTEALEILQQSGAIMRENPTYRRFSPLVFPDTRGRISEEIDRLFPPTSDEREAFETFARRLGEVASR